MATFKVTPFNMNDAGYDSDCALDEELCALTINFGIGDASHFGLDFSFESTRKNWRVPLVSSRWTPTVGDSYIEHGHWIIEAAINSFNRGEQLPSDIANLFAGKYLDFKIVGYKLDYTNSYDDRRDAAVRDSKFWYTDTLTGKSPATSDESAFYQSGTNAAGNATFRFTPWYQTNPNSTSNLQEEYGIKATRGGITVRQYTYSNIVTLGYFCGSTSRRVNAERQFKSSHAPTYLRVAPVVQITLRDNTTNAASAVPLYYDENSALVTSNEFTYSVYMFPSNETTIDTYDIDQICYTTVRWRNKSSSDYAEDWDDIRYTYTISQNSLDPKYYFIYANAIKPLCGFGKPQIVNDLDLSDETPIVPFITTLADCQSNMSLPTSYLYANPYTNMRREDSSLSWSDTHPYGIPITFYRDIYNKLSLRYEITFDDVQYPTIAFDNTLEMTVNFIVTKGLLNSAGTMIRYNSSTDKTTVTFTVDTETPGKLNERYAHIIGQHQRNLAFPESSAYKIKLDDVPVSNGYNVSILPDTLTRRLAHSVSAELNDNSIVAPPLFIAVSAGEEWVHDSHYNANTEEFSCTFKSYNDGLDNGSTVVTIYRRGLNYNSPAVIGRIYFDTLRQLYSSIIVPVTSLYLDGSHSTRAIPVTAYPDTAITDSVSVSTSDEDVATCEYEDGVLTITQVAQGYCVITLSNGTGTTTAVINIVSGSTFQGGIDEEPDSYTSYPEPTNSTTDAASRAQHAYYHALDWKTSQLGPHTAGFDHGIGRGTTYNAAPGQLYAVFSERTNGRFFRSDARYNGVADTPDVFVPTVLHDADDDYWHSNYDAPALLDTGDIGDKNGNDTKRFREVQYVLALDGDANLDVAFAFSVDGAVRKPLTHPVASYDIATDTITVTTEYDEPYAVGNPGKLGEWTLDSATLANSERVRIRQNVTGKGITASTKIVFKMSGHWKLLGVNYVYRPMYSR